MKHLDDNDLAYTVVQSDLFAAYFTTMVNLLYTCATMPPQMHPLCVDKRPGIVTYEDRKGGKFMCSVLTGLSRSFLLLIS